MSQNHDINIRKAKGRPMLTWVGKKPLTRVRAYPAQHVEWFAADAEPNPETDWSDWPDAYEQGGLLFHGDNKDVLAHLLANGFRGKVKLIYIDPPFDSGADYVRKVQLRGVSGSQKLEGEEYTLGEQIQYTDIWANDNYLQFMYERLLMLGELLAEGGALFLHCDWKRAHLLRCLLDEVFGGEAFRNEIIRVKCNPKNSKRRAYGNVHDNVFFYVKGDTPSRAWNIQREDIESEDLERLFEKKTPVGRRYTTVALHARGARRGETGKPWREIEPPAGRHWAYVHSELDRLDEEDLIEWSATNNPRLIRYADEKEGDLVQDIWTMKDPVADEYPTEKPTELIARLIAGSTRPGEIVLDSFLGSGTTAEAAQKLGRRWIGCDINKGAIQTTAKRLQAVMTEQAKSAPRQKELVENEDADPAPCQFSFSTWRVNDYDLQIQHNEAVNLACEYIGVTRNRADGYFDGTRGQRLVKIVPFNHPFTPLDLEDLKEELARRPEEERDVEMVCLGMELNAQAAVEAYNRNRSRGPNRVHVIELRTDNKFGGFIEHEPLTANIHVERKGETLLVEVTDVLSPSIVKRLNMEEGLFRAQIDDWRAVVDAVMIDTNHDGEVFNIALSDLPEKKSDLVEGRYELDAPPAGATVAVKIIDRLGEETVVKRAV